MLSLSKKTDYALLVLSALAERPNEYISLSAVAKERNLPYRFTAQVARALLKSKILESREGISGGYKLAKKAEKITVKDVVLAVEGGIALAACLKSKENICEQASFCPAKKGLPAVQKMVMETLSSKTIADLIKNK